MLKTYRIQRITINDEPFEIDVPAEVTPLITPDGSAIIIIEDVTPTVKGQRVEAEERVD